jgi:hypothetical protein
MLIENCNNDIDNEEYTDGLYDPDCIDVSDDEEDNVLLELEDGEEFFSDVEPSQSEAFTVSDISRDTRRKLRNSGVDLDKLTYGEIEALVYYDEKWSNSSSILDPYVFLQNYRRRNKNKISTTDEVEETTNVSSIGQHKRASIDIINPDNYDCTNESVITEAYVRYDFDDPKDAMINYVEASSDNIYSVEEYYSFEDDSNDIVKLCRIIRNNLDILHDKVDEFELGSGDSSAGDVLEIDDYDVE